jgi:hypothetical protein
MDPVGKLVPLVERPRRGLVAGHLGGNSVELLKEGPLPDPDPLRP